MKYLCDTCILIDYLRGVASIKDKLETDKLENMAMSSVTLMELLVGAINKKEIILIKKAFNEITVIEVSDTISKLATSLIEKYAKSHNLQIPDALIAATSICTSTPLYTLNIADFKYIPLLILV